MLQDNAFKPLLRVSTALGPNETIDRARPSLAFPVGLIRGALTRLGVPCSVTAESTMLPQCFFHVKVSQVGRPDLPPGVSLLPRTLV